MSQKLSKIIDVNSNNEKDIKNYGLGKEVNVEINSLSVIPIIADKIYKDPMSSIRELYDNEKTACNKALQIKPELKDIQKIVIVLNTDTRELTIEGVNSLGMDSYTFMNILRVMGNSGNKEGGLKGLFGIGFFSFFKISERIIIISKSLESQEDFAYICKSAIKFEQLNNENYQSLDQSGFKVCLTVKDSVNLQEIKPYIEDMVKVSNIKTEYIEDGEIFLFEQHNNIKELFESDYSEYFEDPYNCEYSLYWEEYTNEDYDLIIGKLQNSIKSNKGIMKKSYLVNTPITFESDFPYGFLYYLNVKNERKFKPTPDRERFEKESETLLKNSVNEYDLSNHNKNRLTKPNTIQEYYNNLNRYYFEEISDLSLYFNIKSVLYNSEGGKYTRIEKHLKKDKPNSFKYSLSFRKDKLKELWDNERCLVIVPQNKSDLSLDRLEKVGFEPLTVRKTIRESKTNTERSYSKRNTLVKNFKIHTNNGETFDPSFQDQFKFIIRSDTIAEDRRDLANAFGSSYTCYKTIGLVGRKADINASEYNVIYDYLKNKLFNTSHGLLTFEQITKIIKSTTKSKNRNIYNYVKVSDNDVRLKTLMDDKSTFRFISLDSDTNSLMTFWLRKKYYMSLRYESIDDSWKEDIKELIGDDEILNELYDKKFDTYQGQNAEDFDFFKRLKERLKE